MRLTQVQKVEEIITQPNNLHVWLDKITISKDLKYLLAEIDAKVVVEWTGFSLNPSHWVVECDTGNKIGTLEWVTEIFEARRIINRGFKHLEDSLEEEKLVQDVASVLRSTLTLESKGMRFNAKHIQAKAGIMTKHVQEIHNIKKNISFYEKVKHIGINMLAEENKECINHILIMARCAVSVLIKNTSKILEGRRIDKKSLMQLELIPTWVYDHFKTAHNHEEREHHLSDSLHYFFPLNFTNGLSFTTKEILDEKFLQVHSVLTKNNERFLHCVRQTILKDDMRPNLSKEYFEEYQARLEKFRWNLRPPSEDVNQLISTRSNGHGLRVFQCVSTYDIGIPDEKFMECRLNFLSEFNHSWNAIMRFQIINDYPIDNYWDGLFRGCENWNLEEERNLYKWVYQEPRMRSTLDPVYKLKDHDAIKHCILPLLEISMGAHQRLFPVSIKNLTTYLSQPGRSLSLDIRKRTRGFVVRDHVPKVEIWDFQSPEPEDYERARKLLRRKAQGTKEQRANWTTNRIMKSIRHEKDFITRMKIGGHLTRWTGQYLNYPQMDEIIRTTLLNIISDIKEREITRTRELEEQALFGLEIDNNDS